MLQLEYVKITPLTIANAQISTPKIEPFLTGDYLMKSLTIIYFIFSAVSYANINRPDSLDSTNVLPKNVRNMSLRIMMLPTYDKFNNSGTEVGMGDDFNKNITIDDFIDGLENEDDKVLLESDLKAKGYNDFNMSAGQTTGDVNVEAVATTPVFALGVSNNLTLAVAVPYINADVKFDGGFIASNDLRDYSKTLLDTKANKYDEAKEKTDSAIQRTVRNKGYKPIKNERIKGIGDIRLMGRYLLNKSDDFAFSFTNILTLPTGKEKDVNKVIDVPLGDGQVDYEVGIGTTYKISERFSAYGGFNYNIQFADTTSERVPEKSTSSLSEDVDKNVKRNLGDQFRTQVSLNSKITDQIDLMSGYIYQYKAKDTFEGTQYEANRYKWLEQDTEQSLSSLVLGGRFHTMNMYKKGSFKVPMQIGLNYSMALDGKNTAKDNITTMDFSVFF